MPLKGLKGGAGIKPLGYGLGVEAEATDANFNETVLLLHADGSEGDGNTSALGSPNYKAFRDNSTSAHVITINGDAYGNDFSPYYYANGYWSVAFDEASDIQIAHSSEFNAGTGAFTLEGFVYVSSKTDYTTLYSQGYTNAGGILIQTDNNTTGFRVFIDTSNRFTLSEINLNEWVHIAIVRDGSGNLAGYINGVQNQTATGITNDLDNTSVVQIGKGSTSHYLDGYISNLRFIKGTAKYQATSGASNFTVPTTPFTDESGTSFLVCQSNRFMDNSTTGHTLTTSGAPKISANIPFTQTKTANVGSGFFDGTDDYLNATLSSAIGTGDMTVEFWYYPTVFTNYLAPFAVNASGSRGEGFNVGSDGNGKLKFVDTDGTNYESGNNQLQLHSWNHIAIVRDGSTVRIFHNGTQIGTVSNSENWTGTIIAVGARADDFSEEITGYIADCNLVVGTAKYDASGYTVPTSTTSADANTKFLTCQYSGAVRNVGFVDDSQLNSPITRNGDVSLGTFSPFSLEDGYWSSYHVSNSGYYFPHSSDYNLGSGEFTLEFWMYTTFITGTQYICGQVGSGGSGSDTAIQVYITGSSGQLELYVSGASQITSPTSSISVNTWHFVSCVRQSNTLRMYIDGVQVGTVAFSSSVLDSAGGFGVGQTGEYVGDGFKGYISNLRFVVGSCLRDDGTTFTVPTTPLTSTGSETKILTAQSNRFVDNSPTGRTATVSNTPKIIPFSPLAPSRAYTKDAVGGSAFFDGTGDSLKIEPQNDKDVFNPTTTYTVEGWLYVNIDTPGTRHFLSKGGTGAGWGAATGHYFIMFYYSGSVYVQVKKGTSALISIAAAHGPSYQWNHFAVGYDGSTTRFWWNGQSLGSSGDTPVADTATNGDQMYLGVSNDGSTGHWPGYISNVRYVRGTDIYGVSNTSITVPTSPPTAVTNTNFLTTFTNAGIIDHTMKNVLRAVGDTRIVTTDKKFGTGSLVFDGNDYLVAVNTEPRELFTPATGDMTWECFVKFDILDGDHCLFSKYGSGSEYQFYYSNGSTEWRLSYHATTNSWSDGSVSTGTWYHIALVKDGTTVYLFKNGTSLGTNTMTYNTSLSGRPFILGASFNGANSPLYQLKGKLDELRVTRLARYTSNFTAPTKAFPDR